MKKYLLVFSIIFAIVLAVAAPAAAAWGSYSVYEEITISASELRITSITWHPLSIAYSTDSIIVGIQPQSIVFNSSATEKKFVIEIAGSDPNTHLDLAFFDTGIIDVVETTASGATKLTDTSASGVDWKTIDYVLVEIKGSSVKLLAPDGTVLASCSWSSVPSAIEQIGASGGAGSVESGQVVVAILYNPYTQMSEQVNSMFAMLMPMMITMMGLGIVIGVLKMITKMLKDLF